MPSPPHSEKISFVLPPDERWLPMLERNARQYGAVLGFPESLSDMIACSLMEGCEELIRICQEQGVAEPYEVCLDFRDTAAVVQLIYSGRVPLNPHEQEDYEKPSSLDDLDTLEVDALWLHMIKARMDRVLFKVDGARRVLQMVKYRREEAKAQQFWVLGLAPKLRDGLVMDVQGDSAKPRGALVRDSETGAVLRLDAGGAFIVQRLDGQRTLHEIYMEYTDQVGLITPQRLALVFERLESAGMIATADAPNVQSRWRRWLHAAINPNVAIPHADAIVTAAHNWLGPMVSPAGAALLLLAGLSGFAPLLHHGERAFDAAQRVGPFCLGHPWVLAALYGVVLVVVGVHELAHALACKHYGGRVDRMGIMFYLAAFIFYCDTSAAWNFRRRQRVAVSLAGPLTTFAALGGTLWLWGGSAGTGSAREMLWAGAALLCAFMLAMNLNPFLKMDAYYILMDWTNVPNLRERSFSFLRQQLLGRLTRTADGPALSRRERAIFWVYGLVGGAMTVVFFLWPLVRWSRRLFTRHGSVGGLVFGGVVVGLIVIRLARQAFLKLRSVTHREYKLT